MLDLAFQPDRNSRVPLYRQLGDFLRGLVATGRAAPGDKLPATRELAAALALGRNTVTQAYQTLVDEGVLLSHVGQGTFVVSRAVAAAPAAAPPPRGFVWDGLFSRWSRGLALPERLLRAAVRGEFPFDLRPGRVDRASLPLASLRRACSRAVAEHLPRVANQIDPFGWMPLRREIARALVARGIACEPEDVVVTSGAQQALHLTAAILLDPGDVAVLEEPGYFGAAQCFRAAGAQLVGVGVDGEGLRTDELARVLRSRRVKLVYTTPAAQMPTGAVLSDARRAGLLELADEYLTFVLEDDYDSEFRYDNPALAALKTRDRAGQVVYVGTFSKALFPGLRLGYLVAAKPLLARLALARMTCDLGSDALAQAVVMELLASGALERHVRRLRKKYAARRDAMVAALDARMPPGTRFTRPRGGHAVWVSLPRGADPEVVHAHAREAGIAYVRGETAFFTGPESRGADCLALSFVSQSEAVIEEGVARLGEAVARALATRRTA